MEIPLIAMTGNSQSTLALAADVNLDVSIKEEACPLGLAPTTSTTVSLVMGDALAVAMLETKGFSAEDFALSHPGGILGKRLLLLVDEVWHSDKELPIVNENVTISEALIEVTAKKLGMTCVVNAQNQLTGVYTDGDIRRTLTNRYDINTTPVEAVMSRQCKTIMKGTLANDALTSMQTYGITSLVVINDNHEPIAVVHLHDLLRAGVFSSEKI